jgi:two-component system, LytTR family, response regulator LytT
MNVLIVEDERLAAERLATMLVQHDPNYQVGATTDSVEDTVRWLQQHPAPDLVLMDIHLADGLCFNVFRQVPVTSPVIFTTAYDQYAIQAFQVHSIAYLLKPIGQAGLAQALDKLRSLQHQFATWPAAQLQLLAEAVLKQPKNYKTRFLVKFGDHIQYKNLSDVAYFYADGKTVYLVGTDGKKFVIDYILENLEELLDPAYFYRLNRKLIAHIGAVREVRVVGNGRYRVHLRPVPEDEVYVSRERLAGFRAWLDGVEVARQVA